MNKHPIGIIGAMPEEVTTLHQQISNPQITTIAGMTLVSGKIHDKPVVVMQCGIGKVNAALGTALLIEEFSPSVVINTGSAGGIAANLAVGDVVIGDNVAHHDVDVTAFGYAVGQMAGMPENYPSDERLIALAKLSAMSFPNAAINVGQIVSGDQFIADKQQLKTIKMHFPNVLAVDMEAAAIAQVCYCYELPFVVVRAISDSADESASVSFDEFIIQAGQHSAVMVMDMIKSFY